MGKIIDINKEKCYALKKLQNYKIEKLLKLRLHWLDQDPEAETNPITPASGNFKSTYKVLDFKVLFCFYFLSVYWSKYFDYQFLFLQSLVLIFQDLILLLFEL